MCVLSQKKPALSCPVSDDIQADSEVLIKLMHTFFKIAVFVAVIFPFPE